MKIKQSVILFYFLITFAIFFAFGCAGKNFQKNKININSIGMKFTYIKSGEFYMGSPYKEKGRESFIGFSYEEKGIESDEHQRRVTINNGFYLQTTEVTVGQWEAIMGKKRSVIFKDCGEDCPVVLVWMPQIQEFIKRLNKSEKIYKYRLPTEKEWEYACRAGSTEAYFFGNDEKKLNDYAWFNQNSKGVIHRVGQKKPNQWGLYDMHGNVYEYCSDCSSYHSPTTLVDESANPERCAGYAIRGGGAGSDPKNLRAAHRQSIGRSSSSTQVGFRLVRSDDPNIPPMDLWHLKLGKTLQSNWSNDPALQILDPKLSVRVILRILKNGYTENIYYESKSGNALLDEAAMSAIKKSIPFEELPEGKDSYEILIIFSPRGLK